MKNINFFNRISFETLIETNSTYLLDCLVLYGLDKKVLQNKYVVELILKDFIENYNMFCKYPTDNKGKSIPFSVYDLKSLFKSFIDNNGNYSRSLNNEKLTLKVIDENNYEVLKNVKKKEETIKIKHKYVDNLEMERIISVQRGSDVIYNEISSREDNMITFNNIVGFGNEFEKNKILVLPEKIDTLDSGIILSGNSKGYSKDKDFRNYSKTDIDTIIEAMLKIYNLQKNESIQQNKQKSLL